MSQSGLLDLEVDPVPEYIASQYRGDSMPTLLGICQPAREMSLLRRCSDNFALNAISIAPTDTNRRRLMVQFSGEFAHLLLSRLYISNQVSGDQASYIADLRPLLHHFNLVASPQINSRRLHIGFYATKR